MPEMDGLQALKAIRSLYPTLPVIIFSGSTIRGAAITLEALSMGADDYVTKPTHSDGPGAAQRLDRDQLAPKLKALVGRNPKPTPLRQAAMPKVERPAPSDHRAAVVVIGISTGGPEALTALLARLPGDLPSPLLIARHMPPVFTRLLAEHLDAKSALSVSEAVAGQVVRPGQAVLFGPKAMGVVMTGMGQDGLLGCEEMRKQGGQVLAQDEASSVVWGIPGHVIRANLANRVLPLEHLATEIVMRTRRDVPCRGRSA